jgi:protein SCO1/2
MKKTKQTGMLLVLLVLPVFVFAFLKFFGKNEFAALPVLAPEAPSHCPPAQAGTYRVPDFALRADDGQGLSGTGLQGSLYVASAIGPECASAECLQVASALYRAQERFANNPAVRVLSVMASPAADTLQALASYRQQHQAQPGRWLLAFGPADAVQALAQCGWGIAKGQTLAPSPWLVLVDAQGQLRGQYLATDREEVDRLLTEMALLDLEQARVRR